MGGSRKRSVPVTAAPSEGGGAYVAYFPSGFKAAAPSSASSSAASLPFTLYESTSNKRRRELVAHKDGVSYVGKTVSEEFSAAPPCRYLLGVYNKDNGQLQVSNIAGGSVCRVEVRASKADYSANGMFGSVADVSRSLQNKRLVDAFGSTRRRRQLETAEGARVNAERVGATGAVVSMVAAMAKGAKESGMGKDQVMARVAGKRNIPPHHLDAATPEAAFPLGEVVPEGVRLEAGRLLSASEDDAALEAVRERGFVHSYVVGRLPGLAPRADAGDQDKKERKQRAKALSYLSSLLNLHASSKFLKPKAAKGGVSALAKAARIPQDSMEPLLRSFYEQTTGESGEDVYVRSGVNGELLLSHICLAALLAEGCKMDAAQFEQLRLVLRMTSPELLSRFRELGAKATPVSVSKTDSTPASRKYHLSLLQDGRTLAESLPGIKLGRKGGK